MTSEAHKAALVDVPAEKAGTNLDFACELIELVRAPSKEKLPSSWRSVLSWLGQDEESWTLLMHLRTALRE